MAPLVSESVPGAQGPDASLKFGEGTQTAKEMRSLASNTGTSTPQQAASPQQPGAPQQAPQQAQPQHPTDEFPPRDSGGRIDNNRLFTNLTTVNSWRNNAEKWGSSPNAGTYTKYLAKLSKADRGLSQSQ